MAAHHDIEPKLDGNWAIPNNQKRNKDAGRRGGREGGGQFVPGAAALESALPTGPKDVNGVKNNICPFAWMWPRGLRVAL
jgi:hypothetical protein